MNAKLGSKAGNFLSGKRGGRKRKRERERKIDRITETERVRHKERKS